MKYNSQNGHQPAPQADQTKLDDSFLNQQQNRHSTSLEATLQEPHAPDMPSSVTQFSVQDLCTDDLGAQPAPGVGDDGGLLC